MKKIINTLFLSTIGLTCLSPLSIITSCNEPFIVDEEIKQHDKEGWKHAIEYIGSCKHPTLFLSQDASFYIEQCMNLYFASAQYAKQNNYVFTNPGYEYNDQILLVNGYTWNYKENKAGEKSGFFSYNYSAAINSEYGFSDILANSKVISNTINLELGNQMLITNYQDFDLTLEKYDTKRDDYCEWYIEKLKSFCKLINKVIDLYEKVDKNIKFNYVVCDCNFDRYFEKSNWPEEILVQDSEFNKTMTRMLRHMDKFYFCSDGSYTWYDTVSSQKGASRIYFDYFNRHGYTSAKDQENILKLIQTLPFDKAVNYLKYINLWCFYNNEKYIVHFSPSTNTCYSNRVLNEHNHLTKDTTCKYAAPWFITSKYKDVLTNSIYFNNFEKSILKFYNSLSDDGEIKKFENFITPETRPNFDSNKKNLIFILSGAFRESKNPPELLWDECKKITNKIKENYPIDQWNYIFKLHPGTNPSDAEKILKKLIGDPIPNNCIILEKVYPFEFLVSLDQTLVKEGIESKYHLIDPNTFNDDKPSGILTGFDILSTCFYSSMSMLVNEYGYTWDQVKKLVQIDAFYLPRKFDCSNYEAVSGKDYSEINYKQTKGFYNLLNDVNEFTNIDQIKFID